MRRLSSRIPKRTFRLGAFILFLGLFCLLTFLVVADISQHPAVRNQSIISSTQIDTQFNLNTRTVETSQCSTVQADLWNRKGEKAIDLGSEPKVESGTAVAGQVVVYTFDAQAGQSFNFQTSDPLCLYLQAPNHQMVTQPLLPQSGQYTLYVSTPSSSATFELVMSLSQTESTQAEVSPSDPLSVQANMQSVATVASLAPPVYKLNAQELQGDTYLGHLFYPEPEQNRLIIIASYAQQERQRFEFLSLEAGVALMKMIYAARDDGIWLLPASAFRNFERQKKLFDNQVQRFGSIESAAKFSAPPGYSEHHTGYAVDLADGFSVNQDLSMKFADTEAYRWLQQHAAQFGFELSFPLDNPQGVSYEPWHWRFLGSPEAKQIFARAESLSQ